MREEVRLRQVAASTSAKSRVIWTVIVLVTCIPMLAHWTDVLFTAAVLWLMLWIVYDLIYSLLAKILAPEQPAVLWSKGQDLLLDLEHKTYNIDKKCLRWKLLELSNSSDKELQISLSIPTYSGWFIHHYIAKFRSTDDGFQELLDFLQHQSID